MDRLLFGDNQFFGVNHMSEEKARAQAMRFKDLAAIIEVLDAAYDEGIRTFMCTTHERIREVCDHVRADPDRYSGLAFYPGMPYAHKYANAVTENGMLGAVKRFLPDEGLLNAAVRGGSSVARKDIEGLITLLIDAEMKMFDGLRTPVIFLQNVVVDLLLGLGFNEAFRIFANHVSSRYDAEPGFITMNLQRSSTLSRTLASTTRLSAPTSTRSAFECAVVWRRTKRSLVSAGSALWPCPSSPPERSPRMRPSSGSASSRISKRSCSGRRAGATSATPGSLSQSIGPFRRDWSRPCIRRR
jgi:hypothetical protein